MFISLNWINDYVDLSGVDVMKLIDKFTLSCAEVEGVHEYGKNVQGVVAGKILSVDNHPNSKKLHLLKVDKGDEIIDVVCGAPNVRVGMIVPLATLGGVVGDMTIEKVNLAGYPSVGMCCSEKELGISDDNSGLMELPSDTVVGTDIKKIIDIDDIVFEVDNKSLTNRPDLWGHYGIAREIAALTGRPLRDMYLLEPTNDPKLGQVDVTVDSKNCYRYCSIRVENVTKKISPINMRVRLYYAGMRSINLLADITNYIMLELGQPMHAFDGNKVKKIVVKDLNQELEFVTLDNTKRTLKVGTTVITDGEDVTAIAGVMGGLDSEIGDDTSSLLLESANFAGAPIRKTALGLGLRTESSARYEKMLDPEMCSVALYRYLYLLKQTDPSIKITSNMCDIYDTKYPHIDINITKAFIDKYTGIDIPMDKIVSILKSLDFGIKVKGDDIEVSVPSFRATKDISMKVDIVEEISRIYGYDNIEPKSTRDPLLPVKLNDEVALDYAIKYDLATRYNMNEVHSYYWYDTAMNNTLNLNVPSYIKVINSINKDNPDLRSTMIPSLLKVVYDNRKDYSKVNVFEIGRVCSGLDQNKLAIEEKNLGIVSYGSDDVEKMMISLKDTVEYLFDFVIKADFEIVPMNDAPSYLNPKCYYAIKLAGGDKVGYIGLCHPKVKNAIDKNGNIAVCEICMTKLYNRNVKAVKFLKTSKFPTTTLDFTFAMSSEDNYAKLVSLANSIDTELSYKFDLVDIYSAGKVKSYTMRFYVTSMTHTLSGAEIETFHKNVIDTFSNNGINLKL